MGGIISAFLGGAGKAAAEASKMIMADNMQKERDEANFLRDKALRDSDNAYRTEERIASQKFTTQEREANEAFKAEEGRLDRDSTKERTDAEIKARKEEGDADQQSDAGEAKELVLQEVTPSLLAQKRSHEKTGSR